MQWTGYAPGTAEAIKYGLYKQKIGKSWQPCIRDAEGAIPDVDRLFEKGRWNRSGKRFVVMEIELQDYLPPYDADRLHYADGSLGEDSDQPVKPVIPEIKWNEPLTVAQFAKAVRRSPSTIRSWIKKGKIEARQVTVGSKQQWVAPRSALPTE